MFVESCYCLAALLLTWADHHLEFANVSAVNASIANPRRASGAANLNVRQCLAALTLIVSMMSSAAVTNPTSRIMLVHGVWQSGPWEQGYQEALAATLAEEPDLDFEISQQFLGIYSGSQPEVIERFSRHIEALVHERAVDYVVCVLPAACQLIQPLDLDAAHLIAIGADASTATSLSGRQRTTVIESASGSAIAGTLEHIRRLRPNSPNIHFLSGSSMTDRVYLRYAKSEAAKTDGDLEFFFHVAQGPKDLAGITGSLDPATDSAFVLATETYGDPPIAFPTGSLAATVEASAVPVFVFWDAAIGNGIVGGDVVSARAYARQTGDLIQAHLRGQEAPDVIPGGAIAIYDARQVKRWGLDLSRLEEPVTLEYVQPGIWETNRNLVIATSLILVLMAAIILMLLVFLRISREARTRLERSEKEARESEARFRLIADDGVDFIWTYDLARQEFIYCSAAIETLTGYLPEEFIKAPITQMLTADSYERLRQVMKEGIDTTVIEIDHISRSGNTVPCEVSIQALKSDDGTIEQLVGVTRDISERKRREEARDKARQRQKMEALGRLAAGVAHDFNNVLGVIVGLVDVQDVNRTANNQVALNERLRDAAERGRRLVSRILTFSRASVEDRTEIDLRELIAHTQAYLRTSIPVNIAFKVDPVNAPLHVLGDGNQLEQVVINLASNAAEAMEESEGEIVVSLTAVLVEELANTDVGQLIPGEYALIQVQDNGPGIPPQRIEQVFEPFYTSKSSGSGIGLSIVQNVVLEHKGAIRLESVPGQGTTFSVYLPLSDAERILVEQGAGNQLMSPDRTVEPTLCVLVIDDESQLLDVFELMLKALGHVCITCGDAKEAMVVIRENATRLDVIITDYSMPELSGLDILDYCRREAPGVAVFLSTGYSEGQMKDQALGLGAFDVLHKPMNLARLAEALNAVIHGRAVESSADRASSPGRVV